MTTFEPSPPGGDFRVGRMTTRLSIGDFSRMTYLSVKALRHYHEQGVLAPAEVDAATGYRFYSPSQVGPAQMVRRLRDLGMPLDDVRQVLRAPDPESRAATLVAHLRRMERQLEQTQQTVASLRTLLSESPAPLAVERREIPSTPALAVVEHVRATQGIAVHGGDRPRRLRQPRDNGRRQDATQRIFEANQLAAQG